MAPIASNLLVLFVIWARHVVAQTCSSPGPLMLPITDLRVNPGVRDSFMKGIPAKIGTPPQDIVILPRASTSFSKANDVIAAVGALQEITTPGTEIGVKRLASTSLAGTERITLGTSNLTTLPIGIPSLRWDNGYTTLHTLCLGSNSTYLNALVQAGQIPSRVWSLFWGRMWTGVGAVDGSLFLGGYGREKVIGHNFTQPLDYSEDTGCWTCMKVTVSNLFVNFRNGTDVSIMTRNSAVQCCIVPHRQLLWEAPDSSTSPSGNF
ncbi:hypothetical protein B0T14DRAFT_584387 [Immersiella caudata]|uniref:Uncharacterized protein n=1 Tax=Immersiella caudata TaxID=314043 RepID=A0AA39WPA6_9PEZI|nr:hypothetical protein B0T14DRAFT_584387 [Immersiella caudata]